MFSSVLFFCLSSSWESPYEERQSLSLPSSPREGVNIDLSSFQLEKGKSKIVKKDKDKDKDKEKDKDKDNDKDRDEEKDKKKEVEKDKEDKDKEKPADIGDEK